MSRSPDWLSVADDLCHPARRTVPTLAGLVASGAVTLALDSGEAMPPRQANALKAREDAWTADPHCTECGRVIDAPDRAGLIETAQGPRVACRRPCMVHAIARLNPTFNTQAARRRQED